MSGISRTPTPSNSPAIRTGTSPSDEAVFTIAWERLSPGWRGRSPLTLSCGASLARAWRWRPKPYAGGAACSCVDWRGCRSFSRARDLGAQIASTDGTDMWDARSVVDNAAAWQPVSHKPVTSQKARATLTGKRSRSERRSWSGRSGYAARLLLAHYQDGTVSVPDH